MICVQSREASRQTTWQRGGALINIAKTPIARDGLSGLRARDLALSKSPTLMLRLIACQAPATRRRSQ
tara:strand:+ start:89 stop:292 length:204 start_codon:yes stop_codon:yes gene_type:complete